jgi:hypothetical protein
MDLGGLLFRLGFSKYLRLVLIIFKYSIEWTGCLDKSQIRMLQKD